MEAALTALETTGTIDEDHVLRLDEALPLPGSMRVRVIVLYPLPEEEVQEEAAQNAAFLDLAAPEEDIYSLQDGEPFGDQA
ncbi:MAG TPA: hypothetical protein VGS22_24290 [Thermoanaerobaculia bacterium]|jgi:hypothetical protein|nr:hypothetical protein [Thermoanaerobaculia bacterium]